MFFSEETRAFLSCLTIRRVWNITKILTSHLISSVTHRVVHWGNPYSISIEPTTHCNLKCEECPSGQGLFSRPTGMLSLASGKKMIDELLPDLTYLILYFQGEPFLNPDFCEMVRYARSHRVYVATSTNAHFLTEKNIPLILDSGLNKLIVSLDGADQETYNTYRKNGDFATVVQGLQRLCEAKRNHPRKTDLRIVLQFIVFGTNEHQIDKIKEIATAIGVDSLELKTAQVYDFKHGSKFIPKQMKYSRYVRKKDGTYQLKKKIKNSCLRLWSGCVITWDGRVVPCCFDKNADHEMGCLQTENFSSIWRGKKLHLFRSQLLRNRKKIPICCNCSE